MWLMKNTMNAPLPIDIASATVWQHLLQCQTCHEHDLWLTYSQDNTFEMFINIPFIFAGSKILQLHKYFESPYGLL